MIDNTGIDNKFDISNQPISFSVFSNLAKKRFQGVKFCKMAYFTQYLIIAFNILFIDLINCYPDGAPTSQCTTLLPAHGVSSESPNYIIRLDRSTITAGESVNVLIETNGEFTFKGFILQARTSPEIYATVGNFIENQNLVKTLECQSSADTVTHLSRDDKTEVQVEWIAPENFEGTVVFT